MAVNIDTCTACGIKIDEHPGLVTTCHELQRVKCYLDRFRPFTRWAAGLIECTLSKNDDRGKGAWEMESLATKLAKIQEEHDELIDAVNNKSQKDIIDEASDLAVTAFQLASHFDYEMSHLRRGRLKI